MSLYVIVFCALDPSYFRCRLQLYPLQVFLRRWIGITSHLDYGFPRSSQGYVPLPNLCTLHTLLLFDPRHSSVSHCHNCLSAVSSDLLFYLIDTHFQYAQQVVQEGMYTT